MADTDIRRGLLLAEDEALKAKLSGLTVPVPSGEQRVKVWFGLPEKERERSYPMITIDLIDIVFAADRAHSAQLTEIDYWPSEYPTFAAYAAAKDIDFDELEDIPKALWWHPYDLYYQIRTYCRSNQHDRYLTATLLGTAYLPDRWGYLPVPADGSQRWLDRVGYSTDDYYEQAGQDQKRVFIKTYNVVVNAHIPPEDPLIYRKVLEVHGTLVDTQDPGVSAEWQHP